MDRMRHGAQDTREGQKMKRLAEKDVEFSIECLGEPEPIEGNCSAIDPQTDAETAEWIRTELDHGNDWAWCTVKVTATWEGLEGVDYLGCCSYKSEADFKAEGGYYADMKAQALAALQSEVDRLSAAMVR